MHLVDIDPLLGPAYLGDLAARGVEEIRAMRDECQQAETAVSALRRLTHGRLDIAAAELARRSAGEPASDPTALVDQLPRILGGHLRAPGASRLSAQMAPSEEHDLTGELDAVVGSRLSAPAELGDDELRDLTDRLRALETDISARRRALHESLDALQTELVRRYRSGEASVDALLL